MWWWDSNHTLPTQNSSSNGVKAKPTQWGVAVRVFQKAKTEMQGHLETGKGNNRKDGAGRRRSGEALELSGNAQKCGY